MVPFSGEVTGDDVVNPNTMDKSVDPGTEQSPRNADESGKNQVRKRKGRNQVRKKKEEESEKRRGGIRRSRRRQGRRRRKET